MKVAILAGGFGTRLSEETDSKPKPLVNVGPYPILWHIMKTYSHYGFNDFYILLGYKGHLIKEYFSKYYLHHSDVTFDLKNNTTKYHKSTSVPWKVTLIDTGLDSMTGGRLLRAQKYLSDDTFMLTYGDGVADINIKNLVQFHKKHKKVCTVTSVQPEGRFGSLHIENDIVKKLTEKPRGDGHWINGGYFVCDKSIFKYIERGDDNVFEQQPLKKLASINELSAYPHNSFWSPMDSLRDKRKLDEMWNKNKAPWKVWRD